MGRPIAISKLAEVRAFANRLHQDQGKFYHPGATFSFPIHLAPDVEAFVTRLAEQKNMEVDELVNEWLRANMQFFLGTSPKDSGV